MIFLKLFLTFSYIGLFNFGGGYAMLSFIQQEVVMKRGWLTEAEFTDIVAISQMTPGPIGINCATYVGYTSVINDPWVQSLCDEQASSTEQESTALVNPPSTSALLPLEFHPAHQPSPLAHFLGILGSILASLSVVWLPFIVMIMVSKLILKHQNSIVTKSIFSVLRPAIIGLLASASIGLMTIANFGNPSEHLSQFILSIGIFGTVFFGVRKFKWNIIYTTLCCGLIGAIAYGVIGI